MSSRLIIRQFSVGLRRGPPHLIGPVARFQCRSSHHSVPRIAEASVWTAMIPKFFRRDWRHKQPANPKKKGWNPSIYYIIMFILIGSQALRMVQIKNDHANYVRSTEAKIRVLREVIERLQKGEDVDVKKMLGTGNETAEREWEEVLEEIVQEEERWRSSAKKEQCQPAGAEETRPVQSSITTPETADRPQKERAAKFY